MCFDFQKKKKKTYAYKYGEGNCIILIRGIDVSVGPYLKGGDRMILTRLVRLFRHSWEWNRRLC